MTNTKALREAALAFGAAWQKYSDAYDAWRKAHPDERDSGADHGSLPSWIAEVLPSCEQSNVASERLRNIAIRLHEEANPRQKQENGT